MRNPSHPNYGGSVKMRPASADSCFDFLGDLTKATHARRTPVQSHQKYSFPFRSSFTSLSTVPPP